MHRVREPERPRELGEFVTWVEHMNADMLAAGVELGDRFGEQALRDALGAAYAD